MARQTVDMLSEPVWSILIVFLLKVAYTLAKRWLPLLMSKIMLKKDQVTSIIDFWSDQIILLL